MWSRRSRHQHGSRVGERRFLALYFVAGIVAGLCSVVFYPLTGQSYLYIIGASGALFGLMWGYAHFFPDQRILEVTRQLVQGLESLLGTVSDSLERSGWASALRTSTPDARLLKAFDGSVLEALQSFSDRSRLVLTDH